MVTLLAIAFFVLGLIIGSFINAYEYRREQKIRITGRSFCPNCRHQLSWYDLIPVVSWFLLSGRCRYCKKKISFHYPLIEFITGTLFLTVTAKLGFIEKLAQILSQTTLDYGNLIFITLQILLLLFAVSLFIIIGLYDARTRYVLSVLCYLGIAVSTFYHLSVYLEGSEITGFLGYIWPYLLTALVFAGIFFLISFISKESWMGLGDAEIALFMGVFLGWPETLGAFYAAVIIGLIVSVIRILNKRATLKSEIPFGPFLVAGTFLALIFSESLNNFFFSLL